MRRKSTLIIIVSLLLLYVTALWSYKTTHPYIDILPTENQKNYITKIQFLEDEHINFLWEIDTVLSPKVIFDKFKKGEYEAFPIVKEFSSGSSDFDSLWIHLQLPSIDISTTDTSLLICLRPYKYKYLSFSKVTLYHIQNEYPTKYANTGRTVNQQDKLSGHHQNDWCFPLPNNIKEEYPTELLANISAKGKFRDSLYVYYSTEKVETTNRMYRKEDERPQQIYILIFIGILCNFLLYTILQYQQTKEDTYKWYGIYLFSTVIYHAEQLEYYFAVDALASYVIEWHYHYEVPIMMLKYFAYVKFIDIFLNLKDDAPNVHKILNNIAYAILIVPLIDIFVRSIWGIRVSMSLFDWVKIALIFATVYFFYATLLLRDKTDDKRQTTLYNYIILGSIGLIISGLITVSLKDTGLLQELGVFSHRQNINRLGIIIENLFFMSGLAYKARLDMEERSLLEARIKDNKAEAIRAKIPAHTATNISKDIDDLFKNNQLKEAEKYTGLFQRFLRNHYEQSFEKRIKLADELASVESYIELRSINPSRQIKFIKEYNDVDTDYYRIPPGIFIPVVENAINYAFPNKKSKTKNSDEILIQLLEDDNETLVIHIADNGKGIDPKVSKARTSTGLKSLEEICLQYDIHLEVKPNIPKGTVVTFYL